MIVNSGRNEDLVSPILKVIRGELFRGDSGPIRRPTMMSVPMEVSHRPTGTPIGLAFPPPVKGRYKPATATASTGNGHSGHVGYREMQDMPRNSPSAGTSTAGDVDGKSGDYPNQNRPAAPGAAGKRFARHGKVHPADALSEAGESLQGTGAGPMSDDDGDSNGTSTVDSAAAARRGSTLWTSLRAAVNFNSAFLAKKRANRNGAQRVDSFLERFTTRSGRVAGGYDDPESDAKRGEADRAGVDPRTVTVDPDGSFVFYWLLVVTVAVEYNVWFLIAREAWPGLQEAGGATWFVLDYSFDFIYLLDVCVQFRTGYLEHGILVRDGRFLAGHYMRSWSFALDLLSLTPLDFLYVLNPSRLHPIVRFPRFLKAYRMVAWYYMAEAKATLPAVFRIANICHVLVLLVHWAAAFYFLFCERVGFGRGGWVYPDPVGEFNSTTRMYLMSFYWSTLTLTLLGDIPVPSSEWEYIFQIISYLVGVVVFATIVGQVGIVIENRNALQLEFERQVDNAKKYMRTYKVAADVQKRVLLWYFYSWKRSRADVNSLGLLPTKLRTELAIHVHLKTLKKVNIFRECPPEFLHDLVLKMHTCIHTPGDLVCRKGEVAREMFIISDGLLEVVGSDGELLTTLQPGDFFGEIGILNLGGTANRRTANVRSVGYSELFTLSKGDVLEALRDFPQAQEKLEEEARRRLNTNRNSPQSRSRARRAGDSSCTEASDAERLVTKATEGQERIPPVRSRHQSSSDVSPALPRVGAPNGGDVYRRLPSPLAGGWLPKPAGEVALKPSRRKRGSRGSAPSRDRDEEVWLADVMGTMQEKLHDRLDHFNEEKRQQALRIRKLEDELKTMEEEKIRKDEEMKKLTERVLLLEDLLGTAAVEVN